MRSAGIEAVLTDNFSLRCLHTLTGLKFIATASPGTALQDLDTFLGAVYQAYCDFALKVLRRMPPADSYPPEPLLRGGHAHPGGALRKTGGDGRGPAGLREADRGAEDLGPGRLVG